MMEQELSKAESWVEQLLAFRALIWSYLPYLMSREIVVF